MNIAIVDDDDDLRASLAELLERHGHQIKSFSRAEDALAALTAGFRPALVLVDLMMPGMSGWELRQKILSNPSLASIPLTVVTARTAGDEALAGIAPSDVLHKPFSIEDLFEVVDRRRAPA